MHIGPYGPSLPKLISKCQVLRYPTKLIALGSSCNCRLQGLSSSYIRVLSNIYVGQKGRVRGPPLSKSFSIQRGVRQGDPLSPKIFNCVLESVLREVLPQWLRHVFSIHVGGENLTNLRFTDDVILVARTRGQLTNMVQDFFRASAAVGLSDLGVF